MHNINDYLLNVETTIEFKLYVKYMYTNNRSGIKFYRIYKYV